VQDMSYWTFSDVFEEQGIVKTPFYGGFGLLAAGGIPKPAFNAFALLHRLGSERLSTEAAGALVTRRADGALVIALWNYADTDAAAPPPRTVMLKVLHSEATSASVQSIDAGHGNVHVAYEKLGSPRYPTQSELTQLREAAALPPAVTRPIDGGTLTVELGPFGLALVTIPGKTSSARK
jgi:xylan 1,4-beta-xylosidase